MNTTEHPVPTTLIGALVKTGYQQQTLKMLVAAIQGRLEKLNNGEHDNHTEADVLRDLLAIIGDTL